MQQTLAQLVRAKYPGAYDDLSDSQLESSVRAKYPGVYDDLPLSSAKKTEPKAEDRTSGLATLGDFVIGALKGGGETAINLGSMLHQIPGVSSLVDKLYGQEGLSQAAFPEARAAMTPTNTAQSIGKGAERIAELIVPASKVSTAAKAAFGTGKAALAGRMAAEGTGGAVMSAAQGGDPRLGAIGGSLAAGAGRLVEAIPGRLKTQAATQVMQALGPTKERFKAMASKVTPEVLKRGLTGSREALKEQSAQMVAELGPKIDDAIVAVGNRTASTLPIMQALEDSKAPFQMVTGGKTVPLDARALRQIEGLQKVIADTGGTATVEQLVGVRRAWDKIVSQAGGYQQRASGAIGVPLADQSEAAIKKIGATEIRKVLDAAVPELSAINKEYAFWRSLDDVLGQTLSRTAPQSQGLGRKVAQAAGAGVGAMAGSGGGVFGMTSGAMLGAGAAKMLDKVITSPAWALTSAKLKDRLAEALMSGKQARIVDVLGQITSVQASKVGR